MKIDYEGMIINSETKQGWVCLTLSINLFK